MRLIIIILALTFSINYLNAQDKIKTKKKGISYCCGTESYNVLKEDQNIKHGKYKKSSSSLSASMVIGEYKFGEKVGIWEYYTNEFGENKIEQKFDFDNDSLIFNIERENGKFEIFKNGEWILVEDVKQPIVLEGLKNYHLKIIDNIKIPEAAKLDRVNGTVIAYITINELGEVENTEILLGFRMDCNKAILEAINRVKSKWIPSAINGTKYKIKYPIPFKFITSVGQDYQVTYVTISGQQELNFSTWFENKISH